MDLGLPSGTLWLDRMVGAQSPSLPGLYYQWGSINGHTATDGYAFTSQSYSEQGLNTISTNLSEEQDAARAFYGPNAKMPSVQQLRELVTNTSIETIVPNMIKFTSLINGHSIILYGGGSIYDSEISNFGKLRAWGSSYYTAQKAYAIHADEESKTVSSSDVRFHGLNVLAVHS